MLLLVEFIKIAIPTYLLTGCIIFLYRSSANNRRGIEAEKDIVISAFICVFLWPLVLFMAYTMSRKNTIEELKEYESKVVRKKRDK
jgi:hypothetical protein